MAVKKDFEIIFQEIFRRSFYLKFLWRNSLFEFFYFRVKFRFRICIYFIVSPYAYFNIMLFSDKNLTESLPVRRYILCQT